MGCTCQRAGKEDNRGLLWRNFLHGRVFLIRHAESEFNAKWNIISRKYDTSLIDAPITENGL